MAKSKIGVCSFKDTPVGDNVVVLNVTSRSKTWHRCFSPMVLGPVKIEWFDYISQNMENAWQYSKVYAEHIDETSGRPTKNGWAVWAMNGWDNKHGVRYPMGKGRKPEYVWWEAGKLGYIEARKEVYVPLYTEAVYNSQFYKEYHFATLVKECKDLIQEGKEVYL